MVGKLKSKGRFRWGFISFSLEKLWFMLFFNLDRRWALANSSETVTAKVWRFAHVSISLSERVNAALQLHKNNPIWCTTQNHQPPSSHINWCSVYFYIMKIHVSNHTKTPLELWKFSTLVVEFGQTIHLCPISKTECAEKGFLIHLYYYLTDAIKNYTANVEDYFESSKLPALILCVLLMFPLSFY